jgi:WS/DGAT/MGAT family acyltransferase
VSRVRLEPPARRLSSRDAGFLYLERSHAPLHIGCVAVLGGRLSLRDLVRHVEARLPRMRRYAQRAVAVPLSVAHPTWEDDPDLDVRNHVHRWALPAPAGEAELLEAVGELLMRPLDRERPLWEMHLIEGLADGRTAVLQKVHHCMVDGVSGAQLLDVLLDPLPAPVERIAPVLPANELPRSRTRLRRALLEGARRQARATRALLGAVARPAAARQAVAQLRDAAWSVLRLATQDVPELPWNAPIGPRRRLAVTRLPIEGVRRIRRAHGGTLNDVVLTAIAGGLHRYLEATGIPTRALELTALVPVSLRQPHERWSLGNRISALLVPLAVDLGSETARLAATRSLTEQLKASSAWVGIDSVLALLDALPPPLVAAVGRQLKIGRLANLVATNVPGPSDVRYLSETKVESLYPIVPIVDGIGLGIAVFSYAGWLQIGVNADAMHLHDVERLARGIEEAFEALLAAS